MNVEFCLFLPREIFISFFIFLWDFQSYHNKKSFHKQRNYHDFKFVTRMAFQKGSVRRNKAIVGFGVENYYILFFRVFQRYSVALRAKRFMRIFLLLLVQIHHKLNKSIIKDFRSFTFRSDH